MDRPDDKLAVQKITYLAQAYGVDLGYEFEWYLRGPYCRQVSDDAHAITGSVQADAGMDDARIAEFAECIRPHMNDTEWLEIAGSLLYLKENRYQRHDLDGAAGFLMDDLTYGYKKFPARRVYRVLESMKQACMIRRCGLFRRRAVT